MPLEHEKILECNPTQENSLSFTMVSFALGKYHHTCIKILWEGINVIFGTFYFMGFCCFVVSAFWFFKFKIL